MKKQWWILFILLAVGLASVSTISARGPEDTSAKNAFAVRVADLLSLDHDVVAKALTQAKQDLRQPALSKKLEATRIKLDTLVAAGELTRAEADAKITAMSELPLKRLGKKHRGKGKGFSIGVEAKLEAMVLSGKLTEAEAKAKLASFKSGRAKRSRVR